MDRSTPPGRAPAERVVGISHRTTRYDLVLAVIPVSFVAALLVSLTTTVSLTTAVAVAAGIALLAVVDALFFNPPREPTAGPPPA